MTNEKKTIRQHAKANFWVLKLEQTNTKKNPENKEKNQKLANLTNVRVCV
jgi:hypothetical protein